MIGVITGSGFYEFPGLKADKPQLVNTAYGAVLLYNGELEGQEVVFIARHGQDHKYLSHQVNFRANMSILQQYHVKAVLATSAVGLINENIQIGDLVIPDDFYFPDNRLPNGETCTMFTKPAVNGRGYAICNSYFNSALSQQIADVCKKQQISHHKEAVCGHINGPRYGSKTEVKNLKNSGIDVISQTIAPEAVLAAELKIPYSAICYGIDYANGIANDLQITAEAINTEVPKAKELMHKVLLQVVHDFKEVQFEGEVYSFSNQ